MSGDLAGKSMLWISSPSKHSSIRLTLCTCELLSINMFWLTAPQKFHFVGEPCLCTFSPAKYKFTPWIPAHTWLRPHPISTWKSNNSWHTKLKPRHKCGAQKWQNKKKKRGPYCHTQERMNSAAVSHGPLTGRTRKKASIIELNKAVAVSLLNTIPYCQVYPMLPEPSNFFSL